MEKQYLIDKLSGTFKHVFDYIILICPTYVRNKTYHGFTKGDKRFIVFIPPQEKDEINNFLEDIETVFNGKKTLVILDDCAFTKELKQRTNRFISLAFSGRHLDISLWVLTQQLTAIAKSFRKNVACIICFHIPNKKQIKLCDEFGGERSLECKKEFKQILQSEKYSRICFCLRHPYQAYVEIPNIYGFDS